MKNKLLKATLYILLVVLFSVPFAGVINTLISNNFTFIFKTSTFLGHNTFILASVISLIFLLIPVFYIGRKYITSTATSVDKVTKSKSNLHGSSRFLQKKELNKIYPLTELSNENFKAGFVVNTFFDKGKLFGNISYNRHCLMTGTTGCGKTTFFLEPTIQFLAHSSNKPSLVIADPKGELYQKESGVLESKGYTIQKLDLRSPEQSLRFNPLAELYDDYQQQLNEFKNIIQHDEILSEFTKEHTIDTSLIDDINTQYWFEYDGYAYEDFELVNNAVERTRRTILSELKNKVKQIASCIVPKERKAEAIWSEGSRSLISSIIWGLLEDSEIEDLNITKEMVTINQVINILSSEEDYLIDFINNRPSTSNAKTLGSQYANNKAESMRDSFKSMAITFLNNLNGLEYLLGDNEFDFSDFTKKPVAIFLIIPDESDTRYSVATMFITLLYSHLIKEASKTNNRLQRDVMFLLDEFANLPAFEDISKWLSISRSRGILFLLVIQSLGQLNNIYGRDVTSTIQTQCQLNVYLGTTDKETQEYYQYLFGSETVRQTSVSAKPVIGETTSNSENLTGKPLVRTDELGRIKQGESYIKSFQEYPAKTSLIPIFYSELPKYKNLKKYFLVKKASQFVFKPKHFDLSELNYDISQRFICFNPVKESKQGNTESIEDKLILLLKPVEDGKKEAILNAYRQKKYKLVISNLKELERGEIIDSTDTIISDLKNIK